jgi:F-type H+-transporting ATPase subunit epsilon
MKLEILTPRGKEFEGEADALILPTALGQISILNNHAPLVSVLKPGIIKIRNKDKENSFNIEGGIVEAAKNAVVILLKRF